MPALTRGIMVGAATSKHLHAALLQAPENLSDERSSHSPTLPVWGDEDRLKQ